MKSLIFSLLMAVTPTIASGQTDSLTTIRGAEMETTLGDSVAQTTLPQPIDGGASADSSTANHYDRRVHRYRQRWQNLIPTQSVVQFAGNMGLISAGIGWEYGRHKQWETHLLLGYLPKYRSSRAKATLTLKQNYIPWSIYVGRHWSVEPLSCGIYLNTVFGSEFWDKQPARYPDDYYQFLSTKARVNVFVGQRVELEVPENRRKFIKSITAFYEISTCDIYLRQAFQDCSMGFWEIIGLSIGLKFQLL